ncbi:MAG: hypothetical protein ACYC54_12695 [Sedimentisphaerales bacterium]
MKNRIFGFVIILAVIGTADVSCAAFPQDTHIINLYLFNEGNSESGSLNNADSNSFIDSALTGTMQNHENASWPAPVWGSGSNFAGVGTGTGLIFNRIAGQLARAKPWMNVDQGDYANGLSYTVMLRIYATSLSDGVSYGLLGTTSNYININGVSGNRGKIMVKIREGTDGGETSWYFDSYVATGGSVSGTGFLTINQNTWYNLFVIYNADNSITIATDNGTAFTWIKTSNVPADFSTLANGFSDTDRHTIIGSNVGAVDYGGFDGRIESIAIWDKALTTIEADNINLGNTFVACEEVLPGYRMSSDLNSDCKVNFADFAMLASNWAGCNDPEDLLCQPNW